MGVYCKLLYGIGSSPEEIDAVHGATYCVVNNVVEVRDRRAGGRRGGA